MAVKRRKWVDYYDLPEIVKIREHILETFNNKLVFVEETHQYFLDGIEYDCVSHVTHRFKDFDQDAVLNRCVERGTWDVNYKYYGMTKEEILASWNKISGDACAFGTATHEFGESYFYYMIGEDEKILPSCKSKIIDGVLTPTNPHEEAVVQFWNDLPDCFVPVLAETKVFSTTYHYAGTFDILFYFKHPTDDSKSGLVIFDYKTNADLYKNFKKQTLLPPFNELLDMDLSFYKLQLSCYQIPLEDIGYNIVGRRIIWLKPEGVYEKIALENLTRQLRDIL